MFIRAIRVVFLALALTLVFALPLLAQGPVTDDEVNEVAKDLYCPVCESTPLDVCPTQACADWREVIRTQLSEGQSRQEVLDYFAQQYGNGVLANPPREGSGLIFLWLLPIAALALALLFFGGYLRTLRAAAAPNPAVASGARRETTNRHLPAGDLEPYIARIEQEVARFAKSRPNE